MILPLTLAALFAPMPQANTMVRYENPGASARSVLKDLSRLSGVTLRASAGTADEVLALRLTDNPLGDVMKRIAWAVDGDWAPETDGFRLVRTKARVKQEEKGEFELETKLFRDAIGERRTALQGVPAFDLKSAETLAEDVENQMKALDRNGRPAAGREEQLKWAARTPAGRAADRLGLMFAPEELAKLPLNYEVVYSSQPMAAQAPLPDAVLEVAQQYIREQAVWSQTAMKHGPDHGLWYMFGGYDGATRSFDPDQVDRVLLTVCKISRELPAVEFKAMLADRHGRILAELGSNLWANRDGLRLKSPPPAANPPSTFWLTADLADFVEETPNYWTHHPISRRLREELIHPEERDPLGLTVGQLLLQISRAKNQPLVADLPEDSISLLETLAPSPRKAFFADAVLELFGGAYTEREPAGDWIGVRPRWPVSNRAIRTDRGLLGRFLKRWADGRAISLEEIGQFWLALPDDQSVWYGIQRKIAPARIGFNGNDRRLGEIYALLDENQRAAAQTGKLQMRDLPAAAAQVLDRLLHGPDVPYQIKLVPPQVVSGASSSKPAFQGNSIMREPTQCLPEGIPPDGMFTLKMTTIELAHTPLQASNRIVQDGDAIAPAKVAWLKFAEEHPDLCPWLSGYRIPLDAFLYGERTRFDFTFRFSPEISLDETFIAADFGELPVLKLGELPEPFRKEVDFLLAQLEKNFGGLKPGQLGTFPPSDVTNPP